MPGIYKEKKGDIQGENKVMTRDSIFIDLFLYTGRSLSPLAF
jgi:hypothetical protein